MPAPTAPLLVGAAATIALYSLGRHGEKVWFRLEDDRIIIEREDPERLLDAFLQESRKRTVGRLDWKAIAEERFGAAATDQQDP
jgi:hypothetical protein